MLSEQMKQVLDLYNTGLELYKNRKFHEALEKFKKALEVKPDDGPSELYVQRCEAFIETPPPENWDGVFTMTTK